MKTLTAILLVDDEQGFLDVMARRLHRRGIRVCVAASGAQALIAVQHEGFDVVVTDLKMPGMDGLSLLDHLQEVAPTLPVVLLTGHAGEDEAAEAVRRGAMAYLHKPCDLETLLEKVHEVLNREACA